jgi:hypothetical protein
VAVQTAVAGRKEKSKNIIYLNLILDAENADFCFYQRFLRFSASQIGLIKRLTHERLLPG